MCWGRHRALCRSLSSSSNPPIGAVYLVGVPQAGGGGQAASFVQSSATAGLIPPHQRDSQFASAGRAQCCELPKTHAKPAYRAFGTVRRFQRLIFGLACPVHIEWRAGCSQPLFFRSSYAAIMIGTARRSLGRPASVLTRASVGRSNTRRCSVSAEISVVWGSSSA